MIDSILLHPAIRQGFQTAMSELRGDRPLRSLGDAGIDSAIGGGLQSGHLHEVFALDEGDEAAAAGLTLMLAMRLAPGNEPVMWIREASAHRRGALHGPGLVDLGFDPSRLIVGVLPDAAAVLRAGLDSLRCTTLGGVILEIRQDPAVLDLTASRRLALAAEASGVTPLLLRSTPHPRPSAADTRWGVRAIPSQAMDGDVPGHPAFEITLLRRRGGPAGMQWQVEWNRDSLSLRTTPLSGADLPLPAGGPLATGADGTLAE